MILVEELFFNLTLVMFPILIYFVYKCYNQIFINKYNFLMLGIALFTSVYMCFKYGEVGEYNTILLFCNIPILIAYIKKEGIIGILLSLIVVLYAYINLESNIYIIVKILYLLYCLL